jgi:uncharacterized Fe-S cluster protein YjdI/CDGSH-type Zn-finger protein
MPTNRTASTMTATTKESRMNARSYPADGLTIHWDSSVCIHSGVCARTLPGVFKPRSRPWITPEGASAQTVMDVIDNCPSHALTYTHEGHEPMSDSTEPTSAVEITVTENGWYQVQGPTRIIAADGTLIREGEKFFLCRCGHSKSKPFCDSSHREVGFTDDGLGKKKAKD